MTDTKELNRLLEMNEKGTNYDFTNRNYTHQALSNKTISSVNFKKTKFINCFFSGIKFRDCDLEKCEFLNCEFIDCDFGKCNIVNAAFTKSKLHITNFEKCHSLFFSSFIEAEIIKCKFDRLSNIDFNSALIRSTSFRNNESLELNFYATELIGCSFSYGILEKCSFIKAKLIDPRFYH